METIQFKTTIKCAGCIAQVSPVLDEIIGKDRWAVDITQADRILTVSVTDPGETKKVQAAVEKAGFKAEPVK